MHEQRPPLLLTGRALSPRSYPRRLRPIDKLLYHGLGTKGRANRQQARENTDFSRHAEPCGKFMYTFPAICDILKMYWLRRRGRAASFGPLSAPGGRPRISPASPPPADRRLPHDFFAGRGGRPAMKYSGPCPWQRAGSVSLHSGRTYSGSARSEVRSAGYSLPSVLLRFFQNDI